MKYKEKAWEILLYVSCIAMVIALFGVVYRFVVLPAPPEVTAIKLGEDADVLTKLGPRTAVALIVTMTVLLALVFWLFINFGRRLSMRTYLGPLARDAIARAEIARREDSLKEDARFGKMEVELEPGSDEFNKRYRIPLRETPPSLTPGITIDVEGGSREGGTRLPFGDPWGSGRSGVGGLGNGTTQRQHWADGIPKWTAERLEIERKAVLPDDADNDQTKEEKARKLLFIQTEIIERFRQGYRQEQFKAFYKSRGEMITEERDRAEKLLPTMDVSSFGGGWVFVLEFTTIIFIVFAVLALGLLGVLKSEPIATILAAIAGYVLGKSTSISRAGGEEIRRGGEEPKALFEAMAKQEEIRSLRDGEKIKLQRELDDSQRKLAQIKVTVPGVTGFVTDQAENKIKEKNLLPEKKEVENSEAEAGKVFQQHPEPNAEVEKGSTVVLFIAKKPKKP